MMQSRVEESDYHYFRIGVDFISSRVNHLQLKGLMRAIRAMEQVFGGFNLCCVMTLISSSCFITVRARI